MFHVRSILTGLSVVLALAGGAAAAPAAVPAGDQSGDPATKPVVVHPKPIDDLLANPGMGWQTFYRVADEDRNLAGLPSASAYFRFYWGELEPAEGKIDFDRLDTLLLRARKDGQRLCMRVMCAGTDNDYLFVPAWLKEAGCRGAEYQYGGKGPKHWAPDMTDPIFQKAHLRFIEQLGKRYDGRLDLLDIGSVGLWGEWHMSGTGLELPDEATRLKILDAWCDAFPATPKAMLIGDADGLKHAFAKGCGWRADCLGDMGGFTKGWSLMHDLYPQRLRETRAQDVWKTAPVAFEDCWDMRKWAEEGWDVRAVFEYALAVHASYVNNKSAPLPDGARPEVERLLRKLGYRLVLTEVSHPPAVVRGESSTVRMCWENAGVAPPYHDFTLGFRLSASMPADAVAPAVLPTGESIKGWLPGERRVEASLTAPKSLPPGKYQLSIAVLDPSTHLPEVRLAIAGRGEDGWYAVSSIEVK